MPGADDASAALWRTMATAMREDLSGTWTAGTSTDLQRLLHNDRVPPSQRSDVYTLLIESLTRQGRLADALASSIAAPEADHDRWRTTMQVHNVSSSKALQAKEAQREADEERWRREELDHPLHEVRRLNAENETLVQQLTAQTQALEALSQTDALTSIANRRAFNVQLQAAMEHATVAGTPLVMGMINVDDLKSISDIHFHTVGDQVLKELASATRSG